MSKRISKKRLRMQLIRALEKMEVGDGIVLVNGQVVKFSSAIVCISPGASVKPEVEVNGRLNEVVTIRSHSEVWSR